MKIGARLALGGHAIDAADRLAIDQDDALVALAHLRDIALHDDGFAIELGEHLEQRVEILIVALEPEDAGAAIAVERLDDDLLVGSRGKRGSPRGPT